MKAYKSRLAALALLKERQTIMVVSDKELIAVRANVVWLRAWVVRLEARRLVKAVA